jgi:hypothetical protein
MIKLPTQAISAASPQIEEEVRLVPRTDRVLAQTLAISAQKELSDLVKTTPDMDSFEEGAQEVLDQKLTNSPTVEVGEEVAGAVGPAIEQGMVRKIVESDAQRLSESMSKAEEDLFSLVGDMPHPQEYATLRGQAQLLQSNGAAQDLVQRLDRHAGLSRARLGFADIDHDLDISDEDRIQLQRVADLHEEQQLIRDIDTELGSDEVELKRVQAEDDELVQSFAELAGFDGPGAEILKELAPDIELELNSPEFYADALAGGQDSGRSRLGQAIARRINAVAGEAGNPDVVLDASGADIKQIRKLLPGILVEDPESLSALNELYAQIGERTALERSNTASRELQRDDQLGNVPKMATRPGESLNGVIRTLYKKRLADRKEGSV